MLYIRYIWYKIYFTVKFSGGGLILLNKCGIRLYYKNQEELSYALRNYIDNYFEGMVEDEALEEKIYMVIQANKSKFYKANEIAKKPKQILGKSRLNVLEQILKKKQGE